MKKLLLIDANSIIHRAFHAIPSFTTPDGRPSGAIYGIASILLKLWREERPTYAAALFDRPEPTFRDLIYTEYKGKRPPTPSDLISQLIEAHNIFRAFGIQTFEKPGFEADDLIATFAEHFKTEDNLQVVVLTGDRDTLQIVEGEKIVIKTFNKGVSDTTVYDEPTVIAKYGLPPSKLIDYKALVGDNSDNIKGVPGVGPKTGLELIKRFGTIKNMFDHLSKDPKLQEKYGEYKKDAELSFDLVTLERHVPIEIPALSALATAESADAADYFQTMGFDTLIKRLLGEEPTPPRQAKQPKKVSAKEKARNNQPSLF